MKSLRFLSAALLAACLMSAAAYAADPTGTWKWTAQGRNGPQEASAKLVLKDGSVTGAVTNPRGEYPISDATFKDDMIAFTTLLTFGDNKIAVKYSGKLDGDTIKGSIERPGRDGGAATKTDWNAARVKDEAK